MRTYVHPFCPVPGRGAGPGPSRQLNMAIRARSIDAVLQLERANPGPRVVLKLPFANPAADPGTPDVRASPDKRHWLNLFFLLPSESHWAGLLTVFVK